jgi:hypothetical protein
MWDMEHGKLTKKQSNIVEKEEKEENGFVASVASQEEGKSDSWCFDSNASKHMTNRSNWFVEFVEDKSMSDTIILVDHKTHYVQGRGDPQFESRGKTFIFKNVLYIQGLKNNVPSVSEITSQSLHLDVLPPHLGVTRGDHVSWPTMKTMIPMMMMIGILHRQQPLRCLPPHPTQLMHLIDMVHSMMVVQHTRGTLVIVSYKVSHLMH